MGYSKSSTSLILELFCRGPTNGWGRTRSIDATNRFASGAIESDTSRHSDS